MSDPASAQRRAARLVRWYPEAWRERYGEEYTQLLLDEFATGTWSARRQFDVLAHGAWTRLAYTGLVGQAAAPAQRLRAMLGALAALGALFVVLAAAVWSQLAIGWQWSAPTNAGTHEAIALMSAAVLGLGAGMLALAVPLLTRALMRLATGRAPRPWGALLLLCGAAVVLVLGCQHLAPHWPGSGGHAWSGRGLLPAPVARLSWAGTLWISAYWAHPAALGSFPAGEVIWMIISPVAWIVLIGSGLAVVRCAGLTPRLTRWVLATFTGTLALMGAFLIGAVLWLLSGGSGPRNMFAVGAIDLAIITVLGAGLILCTDLIRRAASATLAPAGG